MILIINDKVREDILAVFKLAQQNVISYEQMLKCQETNSPAPCSKLQTMMIPNDYIVKYTHEKNENGIICKHISINHLGQLPHPLVVQEILKEFGFINEMLHLPVWKEKFGCGHVAINIVEPLDGDLSHILKNKNKDKVDGKWIN